MPTLPLTTIPPGTTELGRAPLSLGVTTITAVIDRAVGTSPLNSLSVLDRLILRAQISYDGGVTWSDQQQGIDHGGGSAASSTVVIAAASPTNAARFVRIQIDASITMTLSGTLTLT